MKGEHMQECLLINTIRLEKPCCVTVMGFCVLSMCIFWLKVPCALTQLSSVEDLLQVFPSWSLERQAGGNEEE